MAGFELRDVEITETRQAISEWLGRGRLCHKPTGLFTDYVISWNDKNDQWRALEQLEQNVAKAHTFGSAA